MNNNNNIDWPFFRVIQENTALAKKIFSCISHLKVIQYCVSIQYTLKKYNTICSLKEPGLIPSDFFKPSEILVSEESPNFTHYPW